VIKKVIKWKQPKETELLEAGEIFRDMDAKFAMFTKKLSDYYEVQIVYRGLRSSLCFSKNQPSQKTL